MHATHQQVHRRLLHDDAFGVDEALNETAYGKGLIARGSHYLLVGAKKSTKQPSMQANERLIQLQKLLPSWLFFSNTSKLEYDTWRTEYKNIVSRRVGASAHFRAKCPPH